eukprot:COSAG01_NODE_5416_length_4273_cov_100.931992_1_plen_81_part_00
MTAVAVGSSAEVLSPLLVRLRRGVVCCSDACCSDARLRLLLPVLDICAAGLAATTGLAALAAALSAALACRRRSLVRFPT